jgi:HK97 family phage prohead protease
MTVATLDRPMLKDATLADIAKISGVASSPAPDSYNHIVKTGAFDRSIRARGLTGPKGIKLLLGHNPDKVAGVITSLRTVGDALRIEADLNLRVSYVRDAYEIIKQVGGLSFSVGFKLEDYEETKSHLIIKQGDLHEISIVSFPACSDATMDAKSRVTPPWLAKAMAELQRTQALLSSGATDVEWARFVAEATARQAAIMRKVVEIRRALRKRDREEETLRQWRHEYVDGPRGRLNI